MEPRPPEGPADTEQKGEGEAQQSYYQNQPPHWGHGADYYGWGNAMPWNWWQAAPWNAWNMPRANYGYNPYQQGDHHTRWGYGYQSPQQHPWQEAARGHAYNYGQAPQHYGMFGPWWSAWSHPFFRHHSMRNYQAPYSGHNYGPYQSWENPYRYSYGSGHGHPSFGHGGAPPWWNPYYPNPERGYPVAA